MSGETEGARSWKEATAALSKETAALRAEVRSWKATVENLLEVAERQDEQLADLRRQLEAAVRPVHQPPVNQPPAKLGPDDSPEGTSEA